MSRYDGWCRNLFDSFEDGGIWAVPRCGLVFQKRGNAFVLISKMPHEWEMPLTSEQLDEVQRNEFKSVKKYFGEVGIDIVDGLGG
jgi:hypothetical protein